MTISRRGLLGTAATAAAAATLPALPARAATPTLKIGVLNDMSGPYRDTGGLTSVICTKQALIDFGVSAKGMKVEVVSADHHNKPDVGAGIARQWFDRDGVDVIVDVPTSDVALAVANVCREKNKVMLNSGAATTALTAQQCMPTTVHWTYDTYMLAKSTGGAMVKAGGTTWFFITADYVFGHLLQDQTTMFVKKFGGKVLGSVRYPFPGTSDFSSFLVQAQASGAKVLGLANAGLDTVNSIKQAHEFGLTKSGMRIAGLLVFLSDVHGMGLKIAQGLVLTESFYWDLNDRTRAFTNRVKPKTPNNWPNMDHAGCYAATLHYLKAAHAMGVANAKKSGADAVAQMKKMPTDDDAFGKQTIRADGRFMCPSFLFQVKSPSESKGPFDYYKLLQTTPADQAFMPLSQEGCKLVKS